MLISNKTTQNLHAGWINFDGDLHQPDVIRPGCTFCHDTFVGHVFKACTEGAEGIPLLLYQPRSGAGEYHEVEVLSVAPVDVREVVHARDGHAVQPAGQQGGSSSYWNNIGIFVLLAIALYWWR